MKKLPISKKQLLKIKEAEENELVNLINQQLSKYSNSLLQGLPISLVVDSFRFNEGSLNFILKEFNSDEWEVELQEKRLIFKLKNANI